MKIKKLEREFDKMLDGVLVCIPYPLSEADEVIVRYAGGCSYMNAKETTFYKGQILNPEEIRQIFFSILRQAITQVIESVPLEEDKVKDWFTDYIGYNRHVQEVKQWKKKMLKELKEGK